MATDFPFETETEFRPHYCTNDYTGTFTTVKQPLPSYDNYMHSPHAGSTAINFCPHYHKVTQLSQYFNNHQYCAAIYRKVSLDAMHY